MIAYNSNPPSNHKKMLSVKPLVSSNAVLKDCLLGKYTEVMDHTTMSETSMDDYSYICAYSSVIYSEIRKFSNIAAHVLINPGNHPHDRPALHHFTYRGEQYGFSDSNDSAFFNWRRLQKVIIGHDTWIGHGSVIMPGITIGNGAVVGSNSVVTHDVSPYTIVAGAPAKVIRRRFPSSVSNKLEASCWWDWDHETIKMRFEDFKDIRLFIEKYC